MEERKRGGGRKEKKKKKREGDPKRLEAKWLQLMYKIKKSFSSASKRGKRESGKESLFFSWSNGGAYVPF